MRTAAAIAVLLLLVAPLGTHGALRAKTRRHKKHHHRAVPNKEAAPQQIVLLDEASKETKKADNNEKLADVFTYESSAQKAEDKKEAKQEANKKTAAVDKAAGEMRFAQQRAFPGVQGGANGLYSFGSPNGRGVNDFNTPYRGSFGAINGGYGAFTSVPNMYQGMGSASPMIDPRGFGATGQNDNVTDMFSVKSMFPSMLTPIMPQNNNMHMGPMGMGYANPFPANMRGFGPNTMPFPPFSGKPFRAISPNGPFTTDLNLTLGQAGKDTNTTLMGPLPFGPYGNGGPVTPGQQFGGMMGNGYMGLPQMVNRGQIPATFPGGQARGNHGFVPGVPYGGPQAPFSMPSPYPFMNMGMGASGFSGPMGGFPGQTWGATPGVAPTFNAGILMHHHAMMHQEKMGQFPIPGQTPISANAGFPHPAMDRYHSVMVMPPPSNGMEAAKAAFF